MSLDRDRQTLQQVLSSLQLPALSFSPVTCQTKQATCAYKCYKIAVSLQICCMEDYQR